MTEEERRRFRLLGVFVAEAPITVEAAAAQWGMEDLDDVGRGLSDLADLSLLERDGDIYRQHSLLQAYAHTLLLTCA